MTHGDGMLGVLCGDGMQAGAGTRGAGEGLMATGADTMPDMESHIGDRLLLTGILEMWLEEQDRQEDLLPQGQVDLLLVDEVQLLVMFRQVAEE